MPSGSRTGCHLHKPVIIGAGRVAVPGRRVRCIRRSRQPPCKQLVKRQAWILSADELRNADLNAHVFLAVLCKRSMRSVALQASFFSDTQERLKVIVIPTCRLPQHSHRCGVRFGRITPFIEKAIFGWAGARRQIGLSPES
jgi:hypothetical protein